ncbi:MAG: hypothetical protein OXD47_02460 [Gammaproteobacteria bacterium]|nr:hypothetical protein [Gammaproteobacteria bacterium]MCY4337642.1 hypothetical protein [Gammaproteobacteria bacterium]
MTILIVDLMSHDSGDEVGDFLYEPDFDDPDYAQSVHEKSGPDDDEIESRLEREYQSYVEELNQFGQKY